MWYWGDSIGMEGLLDASELTGDGKYAAFVYGIFKGWVARIQHRSRFEYTAPGVALVRSYTLSGDPVLLRAALNFADYLDTSRKTKTGCPIYDDDVVLDLALGLPQERPGTGDLRKDSGYTPGPTASEPCVSADSIHLQGPFLAALYSITGEKRYLIQAESAIGAQIDLLWDRDEHLFHHFWMEKLERRNGIFWGRGNGWAMLGIIHTLEHLPDESSLSGRLKEILALQAARLSELQDSSGDWHTILDDSSSYLESSIAAFVVNGFCFAIDRGWISSSYWGVVEKAWKAMWHHVREDGFFQGVSYDTLPAFSKEHYKAIPVGALVPWGQGPFLTACRSYLGSRRVSQ